MSFYNNYDDFAIFLQFFEHLNQMSVFKYTTYLDAFNLYKLNARQKYEVMPNYLNTADDFLQFLYEFNIIGYHRQVNGRDRIFWCFHDRSFSKLSPEVLTGM